MSSNLVKTDSAEKMNVVACGRTVVLLRNARQMTCQQLAECADIEPLRLKRIEKGIEPIEPQELSSICAVFNIDVQSFYSIVGVIAAKWRMSVVRGKSENEKKK